MDLNTFFFFKINNLIGKNKFLDAFGRAGAEWAVLAMLAWYISGDLIMNMPSKRLIFWPLTFLALAWSMGWFLNLLIGLIVRKPRPHITHPESKLMFNPLVHWKSFPSDHAMGSFLIFFLAVIFQLPGFWALLPMALWVGWGRVYAGVHYPFDIVGGIAVAGFAAAVCYYLLLFIF